MRVVVLVALSESPRSHAPLQENQKREEHNYVFVVVVASRENADEYTPKLLTFGLDARSEHTQREREY